MTQNHEGEKPNVLDPRQLVRIEAAHRGFLYQHLYLANCLLRAGSAGVDKIMVEADEDVELHREADSVYVQVKTRQGLMEAGDVTGAIERFAVIRAEHAAGARTGTARFVIASNAAPAPKLAGMLASADWPEDVEVHWPGGPAVADPALPQPPIDVNAAASACSTLAAKLPFAMLRPDTLTWKLAGATMLAASGSPPRRDHAFHRDELPALFEQLVVQMQDFPSPPAVYRAQINEPPLSTGGRVRVLSGLSGAGKTAWVAEAATHLGTPAVYLDVGEMPGPALASAVAREVAAKLFGRSHGVLGEILLPGASGMETLGALNIKLGQDGLSVDVVIDNAHRLTPADLKPIVDYAQNVRFLLLCQPGIVTQEIAALLGVEHETLGGWDEDTIAAVVAEAGCVADYADCEHLSRLTGGLPYYVLNAATVAKREYDGRIAAICVDVEAQTNIVATAQQVILKRAFDTMPEPMKEVVAALSLADVPLSRDEASAYLQKACKLTRQSAISSLRQLPDSGAVELFSNAGIKVHDAMRLLGRAYIAGCGADHERESRKLLSATIIESIQKDWSIAKLALLVRLFGQLGQAKILVEFATDELFHEMGVWREIEPFLIAISEDAEEDAETRLWALDGLVFNDLREGDVERGLERIDAMRALLDNNELGPDEWLAWAMKRMLAVSGNDDAQGVMDMLAEVEERLPESDQHHRIFRYNRALAMFKLGAYDLTLQETERLGQEYYDLLGLSPEQVIGRNPPAIRPLLPKGRDNRDDLKHLADTLDLHAQALQRSGGSSPFARIHAMKFYELAHAPQSIIRVGQDLVDDFCVHNDFEGARDVIEKILLPTVQALSLVSWVVPVRSQYAVVLAYLGRFNAAENEMQRLTPYEAGLSPAGKGELQDQRRLIASLRRSGPPPQREVVIPAAVHELLAARNGSAAHSQPRRSKIGRNERCPCQSGRKYKHCHGR
ncbi:hypothetical protein WV31_04845 [Magnetospirillum sp. ME-1]|uniref:SEC-C metal-binding domain-containing protein n=1 Tax=Magnetospirillum sp. ME-1 TaxID=1639348 RepID=UPI000A17B15B|nr:SEC-C metal-binding domain-containing protein [Magnetospirillum sp. ME-1]ARJ65035.1 hypothetical protein WV31_04845 [Magnetospirillum sp. ME-1]